MAAAAGGMRAQLEALAAEYQAIGKESQKAAKASQTFSSQLTENEMVRKELDMVEEDANVYKLIGPALIKQDVTEAKANVDKRIEYITTELNRYEKSIKSLDKKQDEKREEIMKLQAEFQKQQAATADLN
eukprot:PRCOL_00000028-RA